MGLAPWRCFKVLKNKPYPKSKYNRSVPDPKIRIMNTGARKSHVDTFPLCFQLFCKAHCMISSEALEAARIACNKQMVSKLGGKGEFHMQINKVPHDACRFNKMLSAAGADRLQSGMRKSFGKCARRAARCKKDDLLMSIRTHNTPKCREACRYALKMATTKFPIQTEILESDKWGFTCVPREEYVQMRQKRLIHPQGTNITVLKSKGPLNDFFENYARIKAPTVKLAAMHKKTEVSDLNRRFRTFKVQQAQLVM